MNNVIAYVLGESTDNYGVYSQSSNPMMTDTTLYVSSAGATIISEYIMSRPIQRYKTSPPRF